LEDSGFGAYEIAPAKQNVTEYLYRFPHKCAFFGVHSGMDASIHLFDHIIRISCCIASDLTDLIIGGMVVGGQSLPA